MPIHRAEWHWQAEKVVIVVISVMDFLVMDRTILFYLDDSQVFKFSSPEGAYDGEQHRSEPFH